MSDVLIVGGGLAGTASALLLADRGIGSTIVEARGRLGGRAYSRPPSGADGPPAEYGGGWGNAGQPRLQALAIRLGLGLRPRAELVSHRYVRDGAVDDKPCSADEADACAESIRIWREDALRNDPDLLALPLADYFDRRALSAAARREILSWWSISGSSDPGVGALGQLLSPKLAKGFMPKVEELGFTVEAGIQSLAEAAARASGATVLLSEPAERLSQDRAGVTLRLASGRSLSAMAAIVALPVNALEQLRFDPALPEIPARIRRKGHAGRAMKFLIRLRGVEPGHLVTGETGGIRFFWSDHIRPDGSTLVIAFALAGDLPEPDEAHIRIATLTAFPKAEFLSVDWHDWLSDPFARGTWVSPQADEEDAYKHQHWGPFGAIAFAGSDIAPIEQGWFEGALASAELAVEAIARQLAGAATSP